MLKGHFILPVGFDLAAVFLFALTGAFLAIKKGYDYVGIFALALVTGGGGSLIRDGLFLQQGPPALVVDERYLYAVALAGFGALWFGHYEMRGQKWFDRGLLLVDALALGAYAVVGAQKSINVGLGVMAALLVGVANSSGAGLIRDVLTGEEPIFFKPGQYYVVAAAAGCLIFLILGVYLGVWAEIGAVIGITVTFALRMLAIRFDWRTSPVR